MGSMGFMVIYIWGEEIRGRQGDLREVNGREVKVLLI